MKREEIILVLFLVIIVLINGLIGCFLAPFGIVFTPVLIFFTTYNICKECKEMNVILVSCFAYLFVALNDILIKIYAGGTHDYQGLGFILAFTILGLIPSFLYFVFKIYKRNEKMEYKIIAILLFIVLIICHHKMFSKLGLEFQN